MSWYDNLKLTSKLLIGFIFTGALAGIISIVGATLVFANETPLSNQAILYLLLIVVISIFLSILLGILSSKVMSHSLKKVSEAAEKLASGDINVQFQLSTKDEIGEVLSSLSKMNDYLRSQVETAKKIASGDLNFEVNVFSEKDILSRSIKEIQGRTYQLNSELQQMSEQHSAGEIDFFINENQFQGVYKSIAHCINEMIKEHIDVKKKVMVCVEEFSKGNFEAELEKLPGKKAFINENIEQLRSEINQFIYEMNYMSAQHDAGDIDVFVPEEKFQGAYKVMAQGVNGMIKGHIDVKKKAMACVAEFARGNFDAELEKFAGKKAFINENIEGLRNNIKQFIYEMNHMSAQHDAGDIDVFVPEEKFQGAYKEMAQGVNGMVKGHIDVKKKAMACVAEFSKGNFEAELEQFPGKKAFINVNIEALRHNLKELNKEIKQLIIASQEGKLLQRADSQGFQGDFALLIKGLNGLLDAIIEPIKEAEAVLNEMAKGNLQVCVKGDYKGDHAKIKDALNDSINTFNEILNEINNASQQVASGSKQMSDSSLALSQGATEQASAIEQLTASLEEISSQTLKNAENAGHANSLAKDAKSNAEQGNVQMSEMLKAMEEINTASGNISKIIKVIDEIAFQTNILALNAAVEAARAGQHGKGFAVVAEEVRNLAARSANAAKETTDLIEGTIYKVEGGTSIANQTAAALNKIVEGVAEVADIVGDIAKASNEQASAIEQVNQGVMQISQVVQTNSATSEESAAASEELASQADSLKLQVAKFNIRKNNASVFRSYMEEGETSPIGLKNFESLNDRQSAAVYHAAFAETASAKENQIVLSETEFGKY